MQYLTLLMPFIIQSVLSNYTTENGRYSENTSLDYMNSFTSTNVSVDNDVTKSNLTVPLGISGVLDIYSAQLLAVNWDKIKTNLTQSCQKNIETYIVSLTKADIWALKMDDASGRYSTGWFWGNIYWLGSKKLCHHITSAKNVIVNSEKFSNRTTRAVKDSLINTDTLNTAWGKSSQLMIVSDRSPFPTAFFVLRIHLNSSLVKEERVLHIGLCMPYSCTENDIKSIMEITSSSSAEVTVKVEMVRSQRNEYNLWTDKTFFGLCIAISIIGFLMVVGTSFDYYLEHKQMTNMLAKNCADFNTTLEINNSELKPKKGKCELFVVNNNSNIYENSNKNNDVQLNSSELNNNNNNNNNNKHCESDESIAGLIFREVILSFSARANVNQICNQDVGNDTIKVLHGLKVITMVWIILGHACIKAFRHSDNREFRKVFQKDFLFQTITNATFSVDTFFFTSGVLVSFIYFRTNAKGKLDALNQGNNFIAGFLHFMGLISYRFARLTIPYLFTIGIVEVSVRWLSYNSVYEPVRRDHINCPQYWWRNVLYINTLYPVDQMCMVWSWYLSDDSQFYIVGAIILVLAASHFKSGVALLTTFLLSSWMTTGYIAYINNHIPGSDDPLALFDKIYDKPWTRFGPYLIGMCTGWYLFKKNCKVHMTKLTIFGGWTSAFAVLLALVYGLYEVRLDPWFAAAYSSLSHSAWALSLAWIVIACVTGYGGVVDKILSATILYPFSRVTYCAYLLHPIILLLIVMTMDSPMHMSTIFIGVLFFGQLVASYFLAFMFSIVVEAPFVTLLKIIPAVVAEMKKRSTTVST